MNEMLHWVRNAQEAAVRTVLQEACSGDEAEFHPWRGLRPLLGITDPTSLMGAFAEPEDLLDEIVVCRKCAVKSVFERVYTGPVEFEAWFSVLALGEFPNVFKLDEIYRDQLCPIVKLAHIFTEETSRQDDDPISFGHCGNGSKIDFDSRAFQEFRSKGEVFIETFD